MRTITGKFASVTMLAIVVLGFLFAPAPEAQAATTILSGTAKEGGSSNAYCFSPNGTVVTRGAATGPAGQWVLIQSVAFRVGTDYQVHLVASKTEKFQLKSVVSNGIQFSGAAFQHTLNPGHSDRLLLVKTYVSRWRNGAWSTWSPIDTGSHFQYSHGQYIANQNGCYA